MNKLSSSDLVPLIYEWFRIARKNYIMTWAEVWASFWGWALENHNIRQQSTAKRFEDALKMCGIIRNIAVISVMSDGKFLKNRNPEDNMIFPDLDHESGRVKTPANLAF